MRGILFLVHRAPFPPDRGDRIRSFHLLRALAGQAPVHLVAFADTEADRQAAEALRPLCASIHVELRRRPRVLAAAQAFARGCPISVEAFASRSVQAAVDRLLATKPIDAIVAFSSQMAQYVPADRGGRRFLMDFVDVDSAKFAAYADDARPPMRWLWAREADRLFRWERKVAAQADLSLFVSEAEAALFRERTRIRPSRVSVIENGVDLERYDPALVFPPLPPAVRGREPLIVFTGQMDYPPNVEAVVHYATRTLPRVRDAVPDACFAIVGRNPVASVRRLASLPGVRIVGEVPDIRHWIVAADVVAAPLLVARGIQNKVLEAMALGRPVVASPAAFEGIDAVPGREIIVAGRDADAAEATIALLEDKPRARALGAAARSRMVARYGWEGRLAVLPLLLDSIREPVPA